MPPWLLASPPGSTLVLPSGFNVLLAPGGGAATLSDAGVAGAVLVGNGAGDTFNSSGAGVTLVGGQGTNVFKVSGSAAVATGDGKDTVQATGTGAVQVTTGTGGSTVVLAGGGSTVQANGQEWVVRRRRDGTGDGGQGCGRHRRGGPADLHRRHRHLRRVRRQGRAQPFTGGSAFEVAVGTTGALNAKAGSGGGEFFGYAGGDVMQSGSGQTIMVLVVAAGRAPTGAAGNYLVGGTGAAVLDGGGATGNDVFFGGSVHDGDPVRVGQRPDRHGGRGRARCSLGPGRRLCSRSAPARSRRGRGATPW